MKPDAVLFVMAKQPEPGRTKTRLCPPFSPRQAAAFYEAMLLDTLTLASSLPGVQLAAALTPPSALDYFMRITPPETLLLPVEAADLGGCLLQTIENAFGRGFKKVLALNSDGPSLPRAYLLHALSLLDENDLVLGPSEDGGYYLIGLNQLYRQLFENIPWSTSSVLQHTLAQAMCLSLRTDLTSSWYDVDTLPDTTRLAAELAALPPERLAHTRRFLEALPPAVLEARPHQLSHGEKE